MYTHSGIQSVMTGVAMNEYVNQLQAMRLSIGNNPHYNFKGTVEQYIKRYGLKASLWESIKRKYGI